MTERKRAPQNRTLTLTESELESFSKNIVKLNNCKSVEDVKNKTICADLYNSFNYLPEEFVDLLIIDPPYNLNRKFNELKFASMSLENYTEYLDEWLSKLVKMLKPTATIYICGDWKTSTSIHLVGSKYFKVRNRITWERDKGRGASKNWKNNSEDIWYFTMSDRFTFNLDSVKMKRQVIAPYKNENNEPKDWEQTSEGNFRVTHPSNLWNDISIPFWSMPENTDHPTQKPEKLIAKLILASSNEGDFVFDPFLGSGTTSVVAKKLKRNYSGIELDNHYCCLAEKRLSLVDNDTNIQGYFDGFFWERNTLAKMKKTKKTEDE